MPSLPAAAIWDAVLLERRALIDDLELLAPEQWAHPSLCPGWDVHDVLAHLVGSARTTRSRFIRDMIAAGFDFDAANASGVSRERAMTPDATLAEFRRLRGSTRTPPAPLATRIVEVIVHGEDIRRPLGIAHSYPAGPTAAALRHQLRTAVRWGGGKEHARGFRLHASDAEFEHGTGPEVRASSVALLLALSGRPVDGTDFSGPGAVTFVRRLDRASP